MAARSQTGIIAIGAAMLIAWSVVGYFVHRAANRTGNPQPPAPLPVVAKIEPFDGWDTPTAAIIFSGQQHGHMKPCGCSPKFQKGGLARRHGFIEWIRKREWPTISLELGGLLHDPAAQHPANKYLPGPDQSAAKLEITIDALQRMGYQAIGIAPEDLRLESGFLSLVGILKNLPATALLRGVNANLQIESDLQEQVPSHQVHKVGNLEIFVTGLVGDAAGKGISDVLLKWQPPAEALQTIGKPFETADFRAVLLYGDVEEARALARAVPSIDLIIHGSAVDEPRDRIISEGRTSLVTAGTNGKHVGVVGFFPGTETPLRFELITLDERFAESLSIQTLLSKDYVQRLANLDLIRTSPQTPLDDPKERIAGVQACETCHSKAVAKWQGSKHAVALAALTRTGEHVNPECISCHTTQFGRNGGFDGTEATVHLAGNQCENCHGPAGQHVAKPDDLALRQKLHREAPSAEAAICRRCHDADNDPEFNFSTRWREIAHKQEAIADALEYRRQSQK